MFTLRPICLDRRQLGNLLLPPLSSTLRTDTQNAHPAAIIMRSIPLLWRGESAPVSGCGAICRQADGLPSIKVLFRSSDLQHFASNPSVYYDLFARTMWIPLSL
jgi:hypothetical protein